MKRRLLGALAIGLLVSNVVMAQKTGSGSSGNNSTPTQNWKNEISSNYFYIRVADSPTLFWDLSGKHSETAKKDLQFQ